MTTSERLVQAIEHACALIAEQVQNLSQSAVPDKGQAMMQVNRSADAERLKDVIDMADEIVPANNKDMERIDLIQAAIASCQHMAVDAIVLMLRHDVMDMGDAKDSPEQEPKILALHACIVLENLALRDNKSSVDKILAKAIDKCASPDGTYATERLAKLQTDLKRATRYIRMVA